MTYAELLTALHAPKTWLNVSEEGVQLCSWRDTPTPVPMELFERVLPELILISDTLRYKNYALRVNKFEF